MQYKTFAYSDINKRVAYHDKQNPTTPVKYGCIRDVLEPQSNGNQFVDFAEDGSTRSRNYVWATDLTVLNEDHPEYEQRDPTIRSET